MTPQAARLSGGRLHLQHGPIDLILSADGPGHARQDAFAAARVRFETVLEELVAELPDLRRPVTKADRVPKGKIARRMHRATRPFADHVITPMAAVAGSVADEVLSAMCGASELSRAYVNNGGDIALHLVPGQSYASRVCHHDGSHIADIAVSRDDAIRGIASSARHGRSLSLGIADNVTVLAGNAAMADAAATLIANAVDLEPDHPAIQRRRANEVVDDSDLGARAVVTGCGRLSAHDVTRALHAGSEAARPMISAGLVRAVALTLQSETCLLGSHFTLPERSLTHA